MIVFEWPVTGPNLVWKECVSKNRTFDMNVILGQRLYSWQSHIIVLFFFSFCFLVSAAVSGVDEWPFDWWFRSSSWAFWPCFNCCRLNKLLVVVALLATVVGDEGEFVQRLGRIGMSAMEQEWQIEAEEEAGLRAGIKPALAQYSFPLILRIITKIFHLSCTQASAASHTLTLTSGAVPGEVFGHNHRSRS